VIGPFLSWHKQANTHRYIFENFLLLWMRWATFLGFTLRDALHRKLGPCSVMVNSTQWLAVILISRENRGHSLNMGAKVCCWDISEDQERYYLRPFIRPVKSLLHRQYRTNLRSPGLIATKWKFSLTYGHVHNGSHPIRPPRPILRTDAQIFEYLHRSSPYCHGWIARRKLSFESMSMYQHDLNAI